MAWAIFTREFNWHRPGSKISFNAKADGAPKCRPHDFIEAAVKAGAARDGRITEPATGKGTEGKGARQWQRQPPKHFTKWSSRSRTTTPGTWLKICGLTERGVNRTHNMQTSEVPDCDDESLPSALERAVQSSEVTIAANGVWAAESHELMLDWWYSAATKNVRIQHLKAAVGDTEYETGPAYITSLNNVAARGTKVTADLTHRVRRPADQDGSGGAGCMKAKTIAWRGGEHPFLLRIGELRALENACDLGSRMILVQLMSSTFRVDHVLETIRLGLIGGGMPDKDAKRTLDLALNTCSHTALALVAADALEYSLSWDADDQPGESASGGGEPDARPPLPNGKTRWSDYYGIGGAIGIAGPEVERMTEEELVWQVRGWNRAHGADDKAPPMSDERLKELGIQGFLDG